ncbi:MAG: hypothetical protein QXW70_03735 [Candidatus Anstonellales archaeon]
MRARESLDIVCDSSSIISLTDSCLVNVLYFLADMFDGKFIISKGVENECVRRPMGMKSHALGALIIRKAISDGILFVYEESVKESGKEIMDLANHSFFIDGRPLHLVDEGEAETLALAQRIGSSTLLMDERTTRILYEEPMRLARHLEDEFRKKVRVDYRRLYKFLRRVGKINFIRSTELVAVAYEKGFFSSFGKMEKVALESSLYALKFSGASTGFEEIKSYVEKLGFKRSEYK